MNDYLSVFKERDTVREHEQSAFDKALSRGKEKSEAYKAQTPAKQDKTHKKKKEAIE